MSKTVLELVQSILNDMDSEPVNSLSDSIEAQQIASVLSETFDDIISTRDIPEHKQLLKLVASADNNNPTEFSYGSGVYRIQHVWYDVQETNPATDAAREYREVRWCDPLDFLQKLDTVGVSGTDFKTVLERSSGTTLRIRNNKHPQFYTSFDDEYIIMDSYNSAYDSTLQQSKIRAYGTVLPTLDKSDGSSIVDLDKEYTQYLLKETTARCFDLFKSGVTPKLEQSVKRVKNHLRNDEYRTLRPNKRNMYGR